MGLWKVDSVSREEWHRRMLRRHRIRQGFIVVGEILLIVVAVWWIAWVVRGIHP